MASSNPKLWKHQREMVDFFLLNERVLFQAGCGVGKTLSALTCIIEAQAKKVLVVTVKSAIRVWEADIKKHGLDLSVVTLLKGSSKDKLKQLQNSSDRVVVVNYETAILLPLDEFDWDMVIFDESHKLKSPNSKTSKLLAQLLSNVTYKIAMTGTVASDKPIDVWGQVRALHGEWVLGNWWAFYNRYVIYTEYNHMRFIQGYKNLDDLANRLEAFTMTVPRDVVSLPKEVHVERYLELGTPEAKVYKELRKNFYAEIAEDSITTVNVLSATMRLRQLLGGFYRLDTGELLRYESPKLEMLLGLLEEIGDEPVVIFTSFKEEVNIICEQLDDSRGGYSKLTGDDHGEEDWRSGKTQYLVANISAGNAGIDLTRSRYVIYWSLGYSATEYEQSIARVSRPNQVQDTVYYYYLMYDNSLDKIIYETLKSKADIKEQLLNAL